MDNIVESIECTWAEPTWRAVCTTAPQVEFTDQRLPDTWCRRYWKCDCAFINCCMNNNGDFVVCRVVMERKEEEGGSDR